MDPNENDRSRLRNASENRASNFETTQWSAVLLAAGRSSPDADQAFADLCEGYWMPIHAYVRHRVGDVHQAEDITQTFFTKLLEKDYLRSIDPAKGRFRAFLLTAVKRLMANEWDKQSALRRGGGRVRVGLDCAIASDHFAVSGSRAITAEQMFLRDWARTVLDRVFSQLRQEFDEAGKADLFSQLRVFITVGDDQIPVSDVAESLGISLAAVRVAVHRLRRRYRQVLRETVAETVDDPADVDDEIRSLFAAFE